MTKTRLLVLAKIPYDITPTSENKAELIQNIIAEMWPKDGQSTDRSTFVCYVNKHAHKSTNPDQEPMSPAIFGFEDPFGLQETMREKWDNEHENWESCIQPNPHWLQYSYCLDNPKLTRVIFVSEKDIDAQPDSSSTRTLSSSIVRPEYIRTNANHFVYFEAETEISEDRTWEALPRDTTDRPTHTPIYSRHVEKEPIEFNITRELIPGAKIVIELTQDEIREIFKLKDDAYILEDAVTHIEKLIASVTKHGHDPEAFKKRYGFYSDVIRYNSAFAHACVDAFNDEIEETSDCEAAWSRVIDEQLTETAY